MVWDYEVYLNMLRSDSADYNAALGTINGDPNSVMSQNAQNLYREILAQQQAGSAQYWSSGKLANEKAAAADFALRLAENGVGSLKDLGQRTVDKEVFDSEAGTSVQQQTEYYNKTTGEALPDWARVQRSGPLKLNYNLHFTEDGSAIPYTTRESSSWVQFRESTLKPIAGIALAAYGVPYVAGALAGTTVAGVTLTAGSAALTGVSAGLVSGGVSILSGNDFEESLKAALVSGVTATATAGYADKIGQSMGFDAGSVASKAAGSAIIAGAKAGVTDQNVLQSMATSAVSSYLSNKDPKFDATAREGSLAKPGIDDTMTTDFGVNADYSLTGGLTFPSTEGINVDNRGVSEGFELTGGSTPFTGIQDSTSPNLKAMGGAQGVTATEDTGETLAGKDFTTGPSRKDIKTAVKIGTVLMTGNEVVNPILDSGLGSRPSSSADKYRNAPIAGFKMVKYDDPTNGGSKYIPFIGEEALLPPPEGYVRKYAKGGFASKRVSQKTGKQTSFVTRQS